MSTATATELRPRLNKRRFSTADAGRRRDTLSCQHLPQSLDTLDLSTASAKETLASLRFLILSYLADLETSLSHLESSVSDFGAELLKAKGEPKVRTWAKVALEMLDNIRTDVRSHLPEFHLGDVSVESVKSHLPDLPEVASLNEMRSRLPDMDDFRARLPDFSLADISARLDDARTRFSDLDFQPLLYVPILSNRLQSLHAHLSSLERPSGISLRSLPSNSILSNLVDALLSSELVAELKEDVDEAEDLFDLASQEVKNAVRRSFEGSRLIQYCDLPPRWRHNPFVTRGYRQVFCLFALNHSAYLLYPASFRSRNGL
jgi:adiponectin receptor